MSWGITLFAEKKRKNSDKWEMIGTHEIISEVKFMLITDTMESLSYDIDFNETTFDEIDNSELSQGILDFYGGKIDTYHWVKVYPIKDMHKLCDKLIDKFQTTMLMCYKALGINAEPDETNYRLLDLYGEDNRKYTSSGEISKKYNPLTYPVNKELLDQLNEESAGYYKSIWWKGVLSVIEDLAEEDWEQDRDAEIRLVFVRSC